MKMKKEKQQVRQRCLWLLEFMVDTYGYRFRHLSLNDIAQDYHVKYYNIFYWLKKLQKEGYLEIYNISAYKREFIINKEKYKEIIYEEWDNGNR